MLRICILMLVICSLVAAERRSHRFTGPTPEAAFATALVNMWLDHPDVVDRDQDDLLSPVEVMQVSQKAIAVSTFDRADGDQDGFLSRAELGRLVADDRQRARLRTTSNPVRLRPPTAGNANAAFGKEQAYIRDYDVTAGTDGGGIMQPIIDLLRTGSSIGVSGVRVRTR